MYTVTNIGIPEGSIREEHLKILQKALEDAAEFDVRTAEVYAALEYLQARTIHTWGFTLFKEGLETNSPGALQKGLALIRKHLGA